MRTTLLNLAFIIASYAEVDVYKISVDECSELGFVPDDLKCSSCEKLGSYNLEMLMSDCMSCCTKEKEFEHEKYPFAHIEVCECNLGRFPQVEAFVRRNMASQWGNRVRIRHVRGVRPQIVLKDNLGITKQTLNIEKWDTDTITDFLNQWIE
ncbi:Sep15/SelM redox domain protein [Dictyocaulus viviparus]|uniref:Selenoprotein F n=1 Tax=Dictyocaulus viviparus TaxID=29172 RepID=A0A0D8Y098_DICVI|nr:Sep15/SelM redox domain protein [Dictyocaulus viviparus]